MTADQFAYWLQGFAELNSEPPTAEQWQSIKQHLQTVFKKITPPVAGAIAAGGLGDYLKAIPQCAAQPNAANPHAGAQFIC